MKILALETATLSGSVALLDDREGLIGESRVNIKIAHSERLMGSVNWLLNASRVSIHDIDSFAVSIGPGSFTGLRIGLSTAKGFCFATQKPIVPVPTLDALARTLPFCSYLICPMLHARKNEVYTGLYKQEGALLKKIIPETAVKPCDFLKEIKEPAVFLGDGAKSNEKLIRDSLQDKAVFGPPSKMSPSASTVAEIALEIIKTGIHTDPVILTPFYIRKPACRPASPNRGEQAGPKAEIRWKKQ
jgi:tRNA threonylcarbamoyladenosine biosynthesis protein TsaB